MAYAALVFTWAAVLFTASGAWGREGTPSRRALWFALLSLALGWTLRIPPFYRSFDAALGVPNLAQPVGDTLALFTACAILGMLLYQSNESALANRKLRLRLAGLGIALVVMGLAFTRGHARDETTEFWTIYGSRGFLIIYSLAYLACLGYVFTDLTRLCRRYAALTDRPFLRRGLRLIAAAGALGLLYVVLRAGYLIGVRTGLGEELRGYGPLSKALAAVLTVLAVTGAVLPALGPRIQAYRSYRRLRPLWASLYEASPGIALTPPPSPARDLLSLRDLQFRLHSRIVEIRDGRLALRRHFRPDVAAHAEALARQHGMTNTQTAAAVEAATLAAAINDKLAGRPPLTNPAQPAAPGGTDLTSEVDFLQEVARAFTRLPQIQQETRAIR